MTPIMSKTPTADWQRIEALFFACEELTQAVRGPFLDRECADDHALRSEVERLLAADGAVGDRLQKVVQRAVLAESLDQAAAPASAEPTQLGPFRVLRVLGQGGMGTVYLGERADGVFQQQVAIKVVKLGLVGPLVERRFKRERQILARLEHPAIARLLDGGTSSDGQPYLVMEYIDGQPIDDYCDALRLTVDARLALYCAVCAGVQIAHSNLIVHRDIKPGNILVTADGQPKLLDFGISKLLDDDEGAGGGSLTLLGQRLLTPEYASPEQVRDEPITTAVDIYALGLLLHRLLSGDRPYELPTSNGEALRRAICDSQAERPSATVTRLANTHSEQLQTIAAARHVDPKRLRRQLVGDLDHIVAKALRKEPSQRYATVELLVADIQRHLQGLPVLARRGSWRYRAGRFLRRHRGAVAAGVAIFLALAIGLVGQIRETNRANAEATRANAEAQRANRQASTSAAVADFLIELFNASDPNQTRDQLTARDLLDRGVERISSELADQPLVQAQMMSTLGNILHNRGRFADAEPLFAGALERRLQHLPTDHPDTATSLLQLADDMRVQERSAEAMPYYQQAIEIRARHYGLESVEHAEALNNMALGLIRMADFAGASETLQQVLQIRRKTLGDHELVAQSLHNLTLIALDIGDYAKAVEIGQQTLELKARVLAPDHPSTGRTLGMLADAYEELEDYAEAERLLRAALVIMHNAWRPTHPDTLGVEGKLAYLHHLMGDTQAAEAAQRQTLALQREHLGRDNPNVSTTLLRLGRQLQQTGDAAQSEQLFRLALAMRTTQYPEDHPKMGYAQLRLGSLLLSVDRLDEAEALLNSALSIYRQTLPPSHPTIAEVLVEVAELRLQLGDPQLATPIAKEALQIFSASFPADHTRVTEARALLDACMGGKAG